MERMMQTERYKANPDFDNNFVTQLLDNFRSHPAILEFSNKEFYDSKLRAKNNSYEVMQGTEWPELPNKDFPIIFHTCKSCCNYAPNSTSTMNYKEVLLVLDYVEKLILKFDPKDIGVVTPYSAQEQLLKEMLPKEVLVGTAEKFQGKEKLVIIMSCVISNSDTKRATIGFLDDPKRMNVCLTRAKALAIAN